MHATSIITFYSHQHKSASQYCNQKSVSNTDCKVKLQITYSTSIAFVEIFPMTTYKNGHLNRFPSPPEFHTFFFNAKKNTLYFRTFKQLSMTTMANG